jgi:hypothetical protein
MVTTASIVLLTRWKVSRSWTSGRAARSCSAKTVRHPPQQKRTIYYWDSLAAAEAASRNAMNSPVCHTYFALMVGDDADLAAAVNHFEQVQIYV